MVGSDGLVVRTTRASRSTSALTLRCGLWADLFPFAQLWLMDRELEEAKKYMPKHKLKKLQKQIAAEKKAAMA